MITIETSRLLLRNYRVTDFEDIIKYFSDEEVSKFEDFYPMSGEQVKNIITEWQDMDNRLVAELKSKQNVIGSIGYWIDDEGHYCMDYDFNPEYCGQGYATEAGNALIRYLFESVGISTIYGDCDVRNISSWKLLERLGFNRIRRLDNQSYKNDKNGNPILISTFLYELDKAQFNLSNNIKRYLKTSIYTYAGAYRELLISLPDDIAAIGKLVCDQITHPSMYFTEPSAYLEDTYYGKFASYPSHRFKNEDELYITAVSMIAGIFYLDEAGFGENKDVTKRLTVSCRQASILFSAILKAKGIPCRSRAGFMDFGNDGDSYVEHWVNEYWDFGENRWVLVDVDGYYEYEERFGYSQFDLPRYKFITASEAWLGLRRHTLHKNLDVYPTNLLEGVCEYLLMDFHALMNNEIFYSYQPMHLRSGIQALSENELCELDYLAELLEDPDGNIERIEHIWNTKEEWFVLTNNTQNIYQDTFGESCSSGVK